MGNLIGKKKEKPPPPQPPPPQRIPTETDKAKLELKVTPSFTF